MRIKKGTQKLFIDGLRMGQKMLHMLELHTLITIKEGKKYKDLGYSNWAEYCSEELGYSEDHVDNWLKAYKTLGMEILHIAASIGLTGQEIKLLTHSLSDEQKEKLKTKQTLELGDQKISFSMDNQSEVALAIQTLKSHYDREYKEAKRLQSTNNGLDSEIRDREKTIANLETQIKGHKTPEGFDAFFKAIETKVTDCVLMANRLNFKEVFPDPLQKGPAGFPMIAWYNQRVKTMETQFNNLFATLMEAVHGK
ncbi:MAG: hypothetical protein Q8M92_06430 [Candidatus Subteraquimicrobiales bacterium]|nr:hypothetical protein [Candidatus Subteraquimicrobiales bacterium]